jgi:hypothetical protein
MQPINYNLDVANPFQAALQGYQTGAGIQQVQQAQQDQMLKQQQQQQAMQAQQNEQARVTAIHQKYANFKGEMTPMNAIEFASTMPAPMVTALKDQFAALGAEAGKKQLGNMAGILSALKTNPDIAQNLIQQKIDAATNSGNTQEAASFKALQDIAKTNPVQAYNALTPLVAALGKEGQDMLASVYGAEKTGVEIRKLTAEAEQKELEAKFAPQMAQATLQKLLTDTDVAKQNARVNAINAQISREGNDLKRQELQLKLDDAKKTRDSIIREKAADIEIARSSMDNMLNTADRILATPKSVVGSAAGPVSSLIPTTSQSTADFEALVETLGSQAFMAQIPNIKGMGALSDAEGKKLQAALQNFSLKQSPEQLVRNVKEAQRLILKARSTLSNRYGVEESMPDRPAASQRGTPTAPAAGQRNVTVDY